MRKKIVFGMAIISLVAIIVLCQKAGVRLKETFRESEETNSCNERRSRGSRTSCSGTVKFCGSLLRG